jgi:flagellar biosynthetic protein FliR
MGVSGLSSILDADVALRFGLLLARCGGLVAAAPLFGDALVPRPVRALFTGALALLLLPLAPESVQAPAGLGGLAGLAAGEAALGAAMGFVARLALLVFEMAGEAIAIQMGLSIASLIDPLQPFHTTVLGRWYWLVGATLFLMFDGHHHLLRALAASVAAVPPGHAVVGGDVVAALTRFTADGLGRALAIAAPAVGILLATTLGLGLLARTVPQMNVFLVGFPIQIAAGMLAIVAVVPFLAEIARREVLDLAARLATLAAA